MEKAEFIWFNGKLVPWDEAQIHVLSHVAHYGTGVFEGIRAYATSRGPAILGLDRHVDRLFLSCKIIDLPLEYSKRDVSDAIRETVRRNGHESCYIRPLVFRGYGQIGVLPTTSPVEIAIVTFEWGTLHGAEGLEKGVDVGVSSWRRMAPNTHPAMAKASGNYLNSLMVIREAKRHGYAEGIALDREGYVCEASGENLFVLYQRALYTPPLGASILAGVTRGFVFELCADLGFEIKEQRIAREMLYYADEFFMTGTAAEITPVRSVDAMPVGDGVPGPVTKRLQKEFFGILKGEIPDRHGWLTPVGSQ